MYLKSQTQSAIIASIASGDPDVHQILELGTSDPTSDWIGDPLDRQVAAGNPIYNSTIYSNLLWDVNETFRVGFEVTWRQTHYVVAPDKEAAGFHTQFQWSF